MTGDADQGSEERNLARLVQDTLLQAHRLVEAMLPGDLAELTLRLDELSPGDEVKRVANFSLFHQVLFYRVSSVLYREASPTMGELSHSLTVPLSTATRMVGWMVDMGFAERLHDQHDRRVVRVSLTDVGRHAYEALETFMAERLKSIAAVLAPEERSALALGLSKMLSVLDSAES